MQKKCTKFRLSYLDHAVQGCDPSLNCNEICFACFTYTVTIRFNEFKRNKLHVSSAVIVTQKMFRYCGGLRAVSPPQYSNIFCVTTKAYHLEGC